VIHYPLFTNHLAFFRACVEAFAESRYQVVMSIGNNVSLDDPGPIPANFIARKFVPQLEILQRANLFITHGGMNSACARRPEQSLPIRCTLRTARRLEAHSTRRGDIRVPPMRSRPSRRAWASRRLKAVTRRLLCKGIHAHAHTAIHIPPKRAFQAGRAG
jgi:hypothetical protein